MSAVANAPGGGISGFFSKSLAEADPEIARTISDELGRQQNKIELIASENIVSRAVCSRSPGFWCSQTGMPEGYPGKRYYGGCEYVDVTEQLAIDRACQLFGCSYANVQPHSGANANQEVFYALLNPGDAFMGLDLAAGGHLTHGHPANYSGKWFKPIPYTVRKDDQQRIDHGPGGARSPASISPS